LSESKKRIRQKPRRSQRRLALWHSGTWHSGTLALWHSTGRDLLALWHSGTLLWHSGIHGRSEGLAGGVGWLTLSGHFPKMASGHLGVRKPK
jgi:hypothetical protein